MGAKVTGSDIESSLQEQRLVEVTEVGDSEGECGDDGGGGGG